MKLLLRFDDYSEASNSALDMNIIESILSAGYKVLIGVVPAIAGVDWEIRNGIPLRRLSRKRANLIKDLLPHGVEIAMHGYTHQTVSHWNGLSEFGDAVGLQQQIERLLDGKHLIEDLFGSEISWFIPPWNSYGTITLQALRTAGFKAISGDASFGPVDEDMCYAPASCLPSLLPLAIKLAEKDSSAVIIAVLHGYDFRESGFNKEALSLKAFSSILTAAKRDKAKPSGFSEILGASDFDKKRALANQQFRLIAIGPMRYLLPSGMTAPYWSTDMAIKYTGKIIQIRRTLKKMHYFYEKSTNKIIFNLFRYRNQ